MNKINLITLCSEEYLFFAEACVRSFLYYYPEFFVDIYFVNIGDDKKNIFNDISRNITVHNEVVNFSNIYEKKNYCTNRRNFLLKRHLEQSKENDICIWIDSDSLCRKREEKWIDILSSNDVVFYGGIKLPLGGIISVKNTPGGRVFSKLYNESYPQSLYKGSTKVNAQRIWMTNQNVIKGIIEKNHHQFQYTFLSFPFYESKLKVDAYIWLPIHSKKRVGYIDECNLWLSKRIKNNVVYES